MYTPLVSIALLLAAVSAVPILDLQSYDLLLGLELDSPVSSSTTSQSPLSLSKEVVYNLGSIANDATTLNDTLNTFEVDAFLGLFTAITVQTQAAQISKDVQDATLSARFSTGWSSTESYDVAVATLALESTMRSLLANIVRHKPTFTVETSIYGLGRTIKETMMEQSDLVLQLGDVLTEKLAAPFSSFTPLVIAQMLEDFHDAVLLFENCIGVTCLSDLSAEDIKEMAFDRWQLDRVDDDGNMLF